MEKFVKKYPKMYWVIVVGLAVLAFGIITSLGFAKLAKANAGALIDVNFGGTTYYLNTEEYPYYFMCRNYEAMGEDYALLFKDKPTCKLGTGGSYPVLFECDDMLKITCIDGVIGYVNVSPSDNIDMYSTSDYNSNFECVTNMVREARPCEVSLTYEYVVNAPYAVIEDYENYNVFLEYPRGNIDMSCFSVDFSLGGQPMRPENGYEMNYTLYVWLPSAEYMRTKYPLLMEQDFVQNTLLNQDCYDADVLEWQKNVGTNGDSILYKIPLKYEFYNNPETGESGRYRIKFDYKDLLDNMEYALGDGENDFSFREYYGETESDWTGYFQKMVFGHAVISRMDALVHTKIDDVNTYYGRTTTFTFLRNGNFVYSEVSKDSLKEDISSDMSDGINNALQDGLIQSGDKVDELQQEINNVSGALGSFDTEFDGNTLWSAVRSVGSGIVGMSGFVTGFAGVVGSFFKFLPYDMQQIIGYTVIVGVVLILWRLFKR